MMVPNQMYVDGAWVDASDGATVPIVDPATEEAVDCVPRAALADLERALAAADAGWKAWREVDAWSRSAALRRAAEWVRAHVQEIAADADGGAG